MCLLIRPLINISTCICAVIYVSTLLITIPLLLASVANCLRLHITIWMPRHIWQDLRQCRVKTWVTQSWKLADNYGVALLCNKKCCEQLVKEITTIPKHPILRTYSMLKQEFGPEKYLETNSDSRYRIAMSKLGVNTHTLEKAWGSYTKLETCIF